MDGNEKLTTFLIISSRHSPDFDPLHEIRPSLSVIRNVALQYQRVINGSR